DLVGGRGDGTCTGNIGAAATAADGVAVIGAHFRVGKGEADAGRFSAIDSAVIKKADAVAAGGDVIRHGNRESLLITAGAVAGLDTHTITAGFQIARGFQLIVGVIDLE